MAGRFLSITRTEDQLAEDGRSSAGQRVFGESPRWQRCTTDYLDSMISSQTRLPNGRTIHANRESRFGSCSAKPTASKAHRIFSIHRFESGTPWQFNCRRLLNLARLSFTGQVISRFFLSSCAGNYKAVAQSRTSKDMCRIDLDSIALTTKRTLSAIHCLRQDSN